MTIKQIIEKLRPSNIPITFTIILIFLIGIVGDILASALELPYEYSFIFMALVAVIIAFAFRMPKKMRLTTRININSLKFYIVPILYILSVPILFGGYDFSNLTKEIIIMMSGVGVFEEVLTHGICMGLLLNKWGDSHKYKAAIVSAVCFGFVHLNLILQDPTNSSLILKQFSTVVFASFISIGFAGLAYKSNSIWLVAILHAVVDIFVGNVGKAEITIMVFEHWTWKYTFISIIYTFPFCVYGLWLLKETRHPFSTKVDD